MQVSVRFYARAQELAGLPSATINLDAPVSMGTFRKILSARFPRLSPVEAHLALAVVECPEGAPAGAADESQAIVVTGAFTLKGNENILVLPPVSGG